MSNLPNHVTHPSFSPNVGPPISEVQLAPHHEELSIFFGAPCTRRPRNETYTYDKSVLNLRSHGLNYNASYSTSPVTTWSKEESSTRCRSCSNSCCKSGCKRISFSMFLFNISFFLNLFLNFRIICTLSKLTRR